MSDTTKAKCGCLYRSESAASVKSGAELGGYLVERCQRHKLDFEKSTGRRPEPMFPILNDKIVRAVPWALIAPHEKQAQHNHSQSLARLAERGGLSVAEAVMVLMNRPWPHQYRIEQDHHYRVVLMQELMKFEHQRSLPTSGNGG